MIVVSGCPRSGTSLMMNILRTSLGDDGILGRKIIDEPKSDIKVTDKTPIEIKNILDYVQEQIPAEVEEKRKINNEHSKMMNPEGFWECKYTVSGIRYNLNDYDEMESLVNSEKVCKIVSQGLCNSDPKYIDKVIFMVRHPRSVAKSQENLIASPVGVLTDGGGDQDIRKQFKNHSPKMFVNVSFSAARWIQKHKVEVLIVNFEDLVGENSVGEINKVSAFIGKDLSKSYGLVNPTLNRSASSNLVDNDLWEEAEAIHDFLKVGDFQGVADFSTNNYSIQKKQSNFNCPRRGSITGVEQCKLCMTNKIVMGNFKKTSKERNIEWESKPCFYECGFDPYRKDYLTIKESIENNHWVE